MAKDGEEAVEVFRERAADLACVLLDCKMPKLDGPEAFHLMHQIDPGVPVVLLSGYDEADVSAQLTGEGLAGFVHKPFTLADLRSALRRVVPGG